jgi:hypothetical protein
VAVTSAHVELDRVEKHFEASPHCERVTADKFSWKLGRNGYRVKDQAESRHRWAEFEFGRQGSAIALAAVGDAGFLR